MIKNSEPYDLNIPTSCSSNTHILHMVKRALSLGYRTIALNVEVNQNQFMTKKQSKDKNPSIEYLNDFPTPPSIKLQPDDYPELSNQGLSPTILTRLTIKISNNDFMIHYNKSSVAKQYDILAINASTSAALGALLKSSFRFDILTFSVDSIIDGIKWTRKLYYECVEKNVYFELPYSHLIRDSDGRRKVISLSHTYHAIGKSRNIIFTSEARHPLELRSPSDVANLAWILGLTENQGKEAVGVKGWHVLKAAVGRRMGPFQTRIEKITCDNLASVPKSNDQSDSSSSSSSEIESDMDTQ